MSRFIKFPNAFNYIVYKRTYARRKNDYNDITEEWGDTIDRIIKGCRNQLKLNLSTEEEYSLRYNMSNFRATVAGRYLFTLGTPIIDKIGYGSLMNCAYIHVDNINVFSKIFNFLLLGTGVGYGIQKQHIIKLPPVLNKHINITHDNNNVNAYIVDDSREGWIDLLKKTINSHFITGEDFIFNTSKIRPKNTPLSFGGVSSGDEGLIKMIYDVNNILNKNKGLTLQDITISDIICMISRAVVCGNIRRSALLALGDHTSYNFLRSKRWSEGIPNERAFANMTCQIDDINDVLNNDELWHNFQDGEPFGFFNNKLSVSCGRIGETQYKENSSIIGTNACAEMSLHGCGETCNLAEMNLSKFNSYDELLDITKILYKICKHAYLLPCHNKETEEIGRKNWRIGLSFTGYLSSTEQQKRWLSQLYKDLREYDKMYVDIMNELHPEYQMKYSIKLTTIKPSGTLSSSVLSTLNYGAHPAYSKYIIRRMRISSGNPLIDICKKAGYKVYPEEKFDGSIDETTMIIEFYLKANDNSVLAENMTAIDQMEIIKRLQKEWCDNSASVTIYYTLEELPQIKEYLKKNYNDNFKSLSFLLRYNHGFKNAPLEAITEEQYKEYTKNLKDIDLSMLGETKEEELYENSMECAGGSCPIR